MPQFWDQFRNSLSGASRRDLFRRGGLLALAQSLTGTGKAAPLELSSRLYESIGVRPVINARGTFTIISGSQSLAEVKQAMEEASRHYVHLDELMNGVSRRIAEITQAEWAIVTNGCSAALTHFTAAAIAGFNPERMQRLPDLSGLKNEVIIPSYSRNQYDHSIRMLGVKVIEAPDLATLEASIHDRTAMIYILAGLQDSGPFGTKAIVEVASRKKVPVLVDAAAEILTIPNVHLARGATAVAYSGGKCIRGPQAAGFLLGNKEMLQAAWTNSAPHHAIGRSLKVGKEEIMGMLAAIEMWVKRDHKAEWQQWEAKLAYIADQLKGIEGVTASVVQPSADLSNRTPSLRVQWDGTRLGITGQELAKLMLDTEPRIVVANAAGARPNSMSSAVSIVPYMMMPGEEKLVANKLYALLATPPKMESAAAAQAPTISLSGQWELWMDFGRGSAAHSLLFEQDGAKLSGTHRGEFASGDLSGSLAGKLVRFRSSLPTLGSRVSFEFSGALEGEQLQGSVNLGEYGQTTWTARRHKYA